MLDLLPTLTFNANRFHLHFKLMTDPRPAAGPKATLHSDENCIQESDGCAATAIVSDVLLQGRSCMAIDHGGTRYILRATRNGKLILTK